MRSLLSLDDTSPMIGEERLAVTNPKPAPPLITRSWISRIIHPEPPPLRPAPVFIREPDPEPAPPPIISPPVPPVPPDDTVSRFLHNVIESQASLIAYVTRLEARVAELERRTWWSMLKTQVRSWFK